MFLANLNVSPVIVGCVSIGIGIIFLIFGSRLVKPIAFLAGFSLASMATHVLLLNLIENNTINLGDNKDLILLLVPIGVGICVGFLFLFVLKLGLMAIGALAGFALAGFILSWKSASVIDSDVYRPVFIAGLSLLGAVLMLFFEKTLMIIATSMIGAFDICCGADVFIGSGFRRGIEFYVTNSGSYRFNDKSIILLVSYAVLVLFGILIQFKFIKRSSEGK